MNATGSVSLRCSRRCGRDALDVVRSAGLSRAHRPLRGAGPPHVVLATLGPGIIGGDRFDLDVRVESAAALRVGGQMATPVFAAAAPAALSTTLAVEADAVLCSIAEPLVLGAGTALRTSTTITVGDGGVAIVAESLVLDDGAALDAVVLATYDGAETVRDALAIGVADPRARSVATVYRIGVAGRAAARAAAWATIDAAETLRGGVGETDGALVVRIVGDPARAHAVAAGIALGWFSAATSR